MVSLLLYPAFAVVALIALIIYWVFVTVYLASIGSNAAFASNSVCVWCCVSARAGKEVECRDLVVLLRMCVPPADDLLELLRTAVWSELHGGRQCLRVHVRCPPRCRQGPYVPRKNESVRRVLYCCVEAMVSCVYRLDAIVLFVVYPLGQFVTSNSTRFALIYHLFGLLWTNQFIQVSSM